MAGWGHQEDFWGAGCVLHRDPGFDYMAAHLQYVCFSTCILNFNQFFKKDR